MTANTFQMSHIGETHTDDVDLKGAIISFHNINYTVDVKSKLCSKPRKKIVLENMTGLFKPGLNAILGPTGGGKSSLLDVLAGRKAKEGLSGTILVDGNLQPDNFKCMSGYVVQDDVIMGTLTVEENLMFSANLRLSKSISENDKKKRVTEAMEELGILHVAKSKVGTQFIRGISGGERKRTNIGMELIVNSSVLFLDEPTTGLDANTANTVLRLLHRLSRKGRTIIFSIHQPRYSIFKLFDRMMLLSKGLPVYHGPASEACDYFAKIGYLCESLNNPPDFFLDVINGDDDIVNEKEIQNGNCENEVGSHIDDIDYESDREKGSASIDSRTRAKILYEKFRVSNWSKDVENETSIIYDNFNKRQRSGEIVKQPSVEYVTNFFVQFNYLSRRAIVNIIRDPAAALMQAIIMAFVALVIGAIYFNIPRDSDKGVRNSVGAFFFFAMNQSFGSLSALELFIKERVIFRHENVSGFYRCSSYYLSKITCDLLPIRIVPLLVFCVITYWMLDFQHDAGKFFFFFLTLYCTTTCACAIAFVYSATFESFAIANLSTTMTFVVMMLFSGIMVDLGSIGDWLEWMKYFSLMRYCIAGLAINELKGLDFYDTHANGTKIWSKAGERFFQDMGIDYETLWDKWVNIVALVSMSFGYFTLGYIQLRRMKKLK
ncbi:DgyrCDS7102 [Dimorphilus gyrociliatus]|uniref:DgyrCDS7102 n=1 Tax=Dimorphilus gyrociliatus TaxID=2664684 RepID=A0A7I8VV08_9ANNE|nr:DgyrCDS7102 [Dimorphilus gyrociliatus]